MSVESNDNNLSDLLTMVETGKAQLPDFQRSWVWDDSKICKLIESISSGYPMGAGMFLQTGNDSVRFKYRKFEGVPESDDEIVPEYLVLDGQQRLTTLYQVFKSQNAVDTCLSTNKDRRILRFYYLDMEAAIDPNTDRLEAIISIPGTKILTENIGRDVKLDLTSREKEIQAKMFPLNITFSDEERDEWFDEFRDYYEDSEDWPKYKEMRNQFRYILRTIQQYKIPIIKLTKDTSKEAVCQIFENVNTGGVPLTVFELVTATFAADDFDLRKDWNAISEDLVNYRTILRVVESPAFLTAMTLLVSFKKSRDVKSSDSDKLQGVSCKRKDVLKLELADYKTNHDILIKGYKRAADFLIHQGIYSDNDLPYTTQLIPLSAIFAYAEENGINMNIQNNKEILSRWYWCGVFGELYGAANETRYALDIVDVIDQLSGVSKIPETVSRSSFYATRLLSMQTRNSAAYKGVIALILQDRPKDFMSGNDMDVAAYLSEFTDIHHIFPESYCKQKGLLKGKWNSVINKTPIYASTNRSIGGRAPSEYINTMRTKGLTEDQIVEAITSHKIDYELLRTNDFDKFIVDRAIRLCDLIEKATGKKVSGRESDDTIREFGQPLIKGYVEPNLFNMA